MTVLAIQAAEPPSAAPAEAQRAFEIKQHYLNLPIKNGAPKRKVTVLVEGQATVSNEIELADGAPDWWAFMDVSAWRGKSLILQVDQLPAGSGALSVIEQSDVIKDAAQLYREPLRPQFHFSSRRGWNNDPNGLVFFQDVFHLFYQHNPYGWSWGNMHWGHAVSRDLTHWQELGDVLAPDALGPMFSGSAVVDWQNTSGLGLPGQPPLVLIYTAAGQPTVQCLAASTDGRRFNKFADNPVLRQITPGNRDPKVFWHEPTQSWIMVLYVGLPGQDGRAEGRQTVHFLSSPNLRDWTVRSEIEGFFECPDFFELPVDGVATRKLWALTAASSDYMLGTFDGHQFIPTTKKLRGQLGRGFYAAQTFSDIPARDGRRLQIGWLQAPAPGMPFNQAMSIPQELTLRSTPEGPRLVRTPIKELQSLRARPHYIAPNIIAPGGVNLLRHVQAELIELRADFIPEEAQEVIFTVRGATIAYAAARQELIVNGQRAPAPLQDGRLRLIIYCDRTMLEVFASDGLAYVPMPFIPDPNNRAVALATTGSRALINRLDVYELKSAWPSE